MDDRPSTTQQSATGPDPDGQPVVALVRDLMFGSRVRGAAPDAVLARGPAQLIGSVGPGTRLVIVELEAAGALDAIEGARSKGAARVVAFAPHVQEALIAAARDAGAEVLTRGAFVKRLPELVAGARSSDG